MRLYALAQVRVTEIAADPACKGCNTCPGPDDPDSKCHAWRARRPVGERTDWPMCPIGMLRTPSWRALADRFIAARVTPIDDFPSGVTEWAYRGFLEIQAAVRARDDADEKAARQGRPPRSAQMSLRAEED